MVPPIYLLEREVLVDSDLSLWDYAWWFVGATFWMVFPLGRDFYACLFARQGYLGQCFQLPLLPTGEEKNNPITCV